MSWRPEIPLPIARLKAAVVRWRGGVRYGGAQLVVVGTVEAAATGSGGHPLVLRAVRSNQPFILRSSGAAFQPDSLSPGQLVRVTGRVVKGSEANEHDIWLEPERVEPVLPVP